MSNHFCPRCDAGIAVSDINVSEGVALCQMCGSLSRLSELLEHGRNQEADVHAPPRGCSFRHEGARTIVSATMRSLGSAAFFGFFTLFWNSIVLVFVLVALSGVVKHAFGFEPSWMPEIKSEGAPTGDGGLSLGDTVFLCIFLIPFVLVGIGTAAAFLILARGRHQLTIENGRACLSSGAGLLAWRRRFDLTTVRAITTQLSSFHVNHRQLPQIVIEADRTIRFGSTMSDDRRAWMLAALRSVLLPSRR